MKIESFLNEILVDFYCNLCSLNGMSEEEIENLCMNADGLEASDKEVITFYADDINDEMIQDEVYWYIKDNCDEFDIPLANIVGFLTSKYFIYNYDNKNKKLVDYLKTHTIDDIIEMFQEDDEFGRETIEAYIHCITNETLYMEKRKKIFANNDQSTLLKLETLGIEENVITLNELLRNVICNLYNFYISNAYPDIDALNYTWKFFTDNFDPLGELDKLGFDQRTKSAYKQYMLCLMYSDLYEDACNESIIQSENYDDRLANVIPLVMTQLGMITIPKEEGIRNRILKHFILLQDEIEKKCSNRRNTYKENRIGVLKKVNPTFILDELTFKTNS